MYKYLQYNFPEKVDKLFYSTGFNTNTIGYHSYITDTQLWRHEYV